MTRCDVGACSPWQNTHGPNFCETHNCNKDGAPYNGPSWADPDLNPYNGHTLPYNPRKYHNYESRLRRNQKAAEAAERALIAARANAEKAAAERADALNKTTKPQSRRGFWGSIGHHISKHWRTYLAWGGFAACLVVSAGTCLAIGMASAGVTLVAVLVDPKVSNQQTLMNLGINVMAAGVGGYGAKVLGNGPLELTRGWGGIGTKNNVFSVARTKWGRNEWLNAGRKPVNWGYASWAMTANGATGAAACAGTGSCSLWN